MSSYLSSGRHFLQIPGPTNVPEPVLRALAEPTIDHRGPRFAKMARDIQENMRKVFKTKEPVITFPSSGTGAWEAALVNTLSPGDRILMFETGHFATLWRKVAERLDRIFARHARHAEAARRAVRAWGLELQCRDEREYSASLTAIRVPEDHNADALRKVILERFNMSLGNGLGKVAGRVFRIGHLGDFNDLMLMGTLCGVEMGLRLAGVPHKPGGAQAAMDYLAGS